MHILNCRLEVALLLIVYIAYGYTEGGASSFILLTVSSWFLVISWLFAPYIFNPSGFEWQKYGLILSPSPFCSLAIIVCYKDILFSSLSFILVQFNKTAFFKSWFPNVIFIHGVCNTFTELWRTLMIGLLGFFIKVELVSRVTIVGSPGGMKSRFVVFSYSAKVAYAVYCFESKFLVICA